jgi:hypothetical protein
MMTLTVKDNGVRVANPSYRGQRVHANEIKQYHSTLLKELGFKKQSSRWIHKSTMPFKASSLCVVWRDSPHTLSVQRGNFLKHIEVHENADLHDFVSNVLQSIRDVWTEGAK